MIVSWQWHKNHIIPISNNISHVRNCHPLICSCQQVQMAHEVKSTRKMQSANERGQWLVPLTCNQQEVTSLSIHIVHAHPKVQHIVLTNSFEQSSMTPLPYPIDNNTIPTMTINLNIDDMNNVWVIPYSVNCNLWLVTSGTQWLFWELDVAQGWMNQYKLAE